MEKIITVDFDDTLDRKYVQKYIEDLVRNKNIKVFILTTRYDELHLHNYDFENASHIKLYLIAKKIGIPKHNIFFTNMEYKHKFLKDTNVLAHLDDSSIEINKINKNTKTIGVSVLSSNWKQKLDKILFNS